jgi:glucokinase-like ROK family protein
MGFGRDLTTKKTRAYDAIIVPNWQSEAVVSHHQLIVSHSEKEVLDLVRSRGEITKGDLVDQTDYSRTKITSCIDSLQKKSYLVENLDKEYTGGRRSRTYSLNGKLGLVAGVDIGATSIDLAISDLSHKILVRHSESSFVREGPIKILGRVCTLLEELLQKNNLKSENVLGIGIGIPGPVDFSHGMVISPPIMPGWDRYPIIETVQQWFPSTYVIVDNDVNVMALGELYGGRGKGIRDLIFVKIGTGIGAGIVCEGKIYRGASGCAGDIGHISVNKDGPVCPCGNTGCLEAMAGGPAIASRALLEAQAGKSPILMKRYTENGGFLMAEDIGIAAREGDTVSIEIIRESGQYVGDVLAGLVNFFNPEMIVIGGGVSNLGNLLLSSIRQAVLNRSLPLSTRNLDIVFSGTGADAGVIGAVTLAVDNLFVIENGSRNTDLD